MKKITVVAVLFSLFCSEFAVAGPPTEQYELIKQIQDHNISCVQRRNIARRVWKNAFGKETNLDFVKFNEILLKKWMPECIPEDNIDFFLTEEEINV